MKKFLLLCLSCLLLSGCAAYKFQRGQAPYDKGYVASRAGLIIPEYTLGKDNNPPDDLKVAKARFKRRRGIVEHYYKKMGYMENNFKTYFLNYPIMISKVMGGVFRLPGIAVSDYRYEHNPAYKARVDAAEQKSDEQEAGRIKKLKDYLQTYIDRDLFYEESGFTGPKPVEGLRPSAAAETAVKEEAKPEQAVATVEQNAMPAKEAVVEAVMKSKEEANVSGVSAVIITNPAKGLSPLQVHFSGSRSHSISGKIIAYSWDFGDGDVSNKPNPVNTYYSASFEPRNFNVTLTVTDNAGNSASANYTVEVLNK